MFENLFQRILYLVVEDYCRVQSVKKHPTQTGKISGKENGTEVMVDIQAAGSAASQTSSALFQSRQADQAADERKVSRDSDVERQETERVEKRSRVRADDNRAADRRRESRRAAARREGVGQRVDVHA